MAFAAVPLIQALAMYFGFPLFWGSISGQDQAVDLSPAGGIFAGIAGVSGVLVTAAGAVPIFLWLRRRGPVTLVQTVTAGIVLGNAPFAGYVLLLVLPLTILHLARGTLSQHVIPLPSLLSSTLRVILLGSVLGVIGALAFWVLGLAGNNTAKSRS